MSEPNPDTSPLPLGKLETVKKVGMQTVRQNSQELPADHPGISADSKASCPVTGLSGKTMAQQQQQSEISLEEQVYGSGVDNMTKRMLDGIGNIVMITDFYGNIRYLNELGRHSLVFEESLYDGKIISIDHFMLEDVASVHSAYMNNFRSKLRYLSAHSEETSRRMAYDIFRMSKDRVIIVKRCDGTTFRAEIGLKVLEDPDGQDQLMVATVHDITQEVAFMAERQRLQDQKIKHLEQLQAKEQRLRESAEQQIRERNDTEDKEKLLYALLNHELRNPLQVILNCAELLSGDLEDAKENAASIDFAQSVDVLLSLTVSAELMSHLIDNAQQFSKIKDPNYVPAVHEFKPHYEFSRVCKLFEYVGTMEGKIVTHSIGFTPNERFLCPSLTGVVINLFANALKFTPSDKKVSVHFSAERVTEPDFDGVEFIVTDHGVGFSADLTAVMFDPFIDIKNPTQSKKKDAKDDLTALFGGSGLALYYCRQLLKAAGGSLRAESEPNVQTKFIGRMPWVAMESSPQIQQQQSTDDDATTDYEQQRGLKNRRPENLILPSDEAATRNRKKVPPSPADPAFLTETERSETSFSQGKPSKRKKKRVQYRKGPRRHILYIDDTVLNIRSTERVLRRLGHSCETASSGEQGIKLFMKIHNSLDLVLMDLSMPQMDGKEAAHHILEWCNENKVQAPPILAYSGTVTPLILQQVKAVGMVGLVSKGLDISTFAYTIDKHTVSSPLQGKTPKTHARTIASAIKREPLTRR